MKQDKSLGADQRASSGSRAAANDGARRESSESRPQDGLVATSRLWSGPTLFCAPIWSELKPSRCARDNHHWRAIETYRRAAVKLTERAGAQVESSRAPATALGTATGRN